MERACSLGVWAKKYQQGLGLSQRNVNYEWLPRVLLGWGADPERGLRRF